MTDAAVQISPDSTGKLIDAQALTNGASQTVYRQTVTVGDSNTIGSVQSVKPGNTAATPADGAAVFVRRPDDGGSAGIDASANAPSWPNIGSNFGAGHPLYPSWFLLKTVAANPARQNITVDNMDLALPVLVLRDDGTAASGGSPVNATGFTLNAKVTAGPEGGHFASATFRGRLQVFGSSSSQFVAISTD